MYQKLVVCVLCFALVATLPTVYKYNDNKLLEPDLVPVSSTVIPLPIYQVGYGINVAPSKTETKAKKPDGPVSLVTVYSKKKASELTKNTSTTKQGNKKE
ncbi:uncharacterized protein LOC109604080 [Aethina tumida]|uniref:uncharacterized protein LOC109604080 n=1 Tax=Aethina tumida TaxID=116153 RepID=UPI002147C732|nr:uncharacterized protein LOC109604080 [Aethina tumida]